MSIEAILVLIGGILIALDLILGYGYAPYRDNGRGRLLLSVGSLLVAIGTFIYLTGK